MSSSPGPLARLHHRAILDRPLAALLVLVGLLAFAAYHAQHFELDASADSLLLEDDPDLQLFRQVGARYATRDLLVVTFLPDGVLFEDEALGHLAGLRDALATVEGVESVTSLLDVPLVESSDVPLAEMASAVQTLETEGVERARAVRELTASPVFGDLIISRDRTTTAILVNLEHDEQHAALLAERNELLVERGAGTLGPSGQRELERVTVAYQRSAAARGPWMHQVIGDVREAIAPFRAYGQVHLGGVPMIADDMVTFVKSDLVVFGSSVFVFLVFVLTVIFRQVRWVVLPLLSCFYATVIMLGVLGLVGWKVTVISSNFLALMLIITISMNIHLAVRYLGLARKTPEATQRELVGETLNKMVWPCLYTALTTIIGFGSLVLSDIKPVRDFGWMMSMGLAVAFLTSFTFFPAVLMLLRPKGERHGREEVPITRALAGVTRRHGRVILAVSAGLAIVAGVGISRLTVENSFIDYFRQDTEIYQGMKLIDEKLGGTTPADVLLSFAPQPLPGEPEPAVEEDDDFEEWELETWDTETTSSDAYWFTPYKVERIKRVHDYLAAQPEIGKVLSLASIVRVAEALNEGQPLNAVELALVYDKLPKDIRSSLLDPYVSVENDEARVLLRIKDSQEGLRRGPLLERIREGFRDELGLDEGRVQVTGTLVLYNNMLRSLYQSQISSLGAVMAGIAAMFLLLFRSVRLAVIGIVPNLLAAGIVLGLMGLAGIPLDVMTITIAAITIGIAVDNGIHYIYRFREELRESGDYGKTLEICHANIGRAVFYTSTTVIFGFSILVLSNFLPTIYFGVLTGLAMLIALLASLTLLPLLILAWKPFGIGDTPPAEG